MPCMTHTAVTPAVASSTVLARSLRACVRADGCGAPPPRLARWLSGMLAARGTHNSIVLPGGAEWPGLRSSVLFVRRFYDDLWGRVLGCGFAHPTAIILGSAGSELEGNGRLGLRPSRHWSAPFEASLFEASMGASLVHHPHPAAPPHSSYPPSLPFRRPHRHASLAARPRASPAVAKSAFGLYAVFRAVREGRAVIYDSRKGGSALFKGGKAYALPSEHCQLQNLAAMSSRETLYVSDGVEPAPQDRACRLLISPPGSKDTRWFSVSKSGGVRALVLPVFTHEEVLELHALAFTHEPRCSAPDVAERMRK